MKKIIFFIQIELAKLLNTLGFSKVGADLWKSALAEKESTNHSVVILGNLYNDAPPKISYDNLSEVLKTKKIKVAISNFWIGFSLDCGFVKYLLDESLGEWEEVSNLSDADVILTSVFPHVISSFPEKTIAFIWENIRPDYRYYRFSVSSDFDNYSGRNIRCPLWYAEIAWSSRYIRAGLSERGAHGNEQLIPLESLLKPRAGFVKKRKFCSFVAGNPEPHRMMAVEALNRVEEVEIYGPISGKIEKRSKYKILKNYCFSLCFENSIFPGYYTEKLLQAWVAGTVPLYFSDQRVCEDFNVKSFINKSSYQSLDDFVVDISEIYQSKERLREIWSEPLLVTKPVLEPVIDFLRKSIFCIIEEKSNKE